jgi:hypothetical protein
MSALNYECPETHRVVTTAIVTDKTTLERMQSRGLKLAVWCSHCSTSHNISAIAAWTVETVAA